MTQERAWPPIWKSGRGYSQVAAELYSLRLMQDLAVDLIRTLLAIISLAAGLQVSFADSVTLEWDPSPDPDIIGYHLYYGIASQTYTSFVDAGPSTTATVDNLVPGITYYFAATTVDSSGLESSFSSEVVYQPAPSPCSILLGELVQSYDGTPKPVTATINPLNVALVITYDGLATPPTDAGTYQVAASILDLACVTSVSNTLTITKAVASIWLENPDPTYDGGPKQIVVTTTPPGLAVNITYNGRPDPPAAAGIYEVIGTIVDANYSGTATGLLTIEQSYAAIQLANLDQIYDGTPKSIQALTVPANLGVTVSYNGLPNPPIAAGTYQVTARINDPNYAGTNTDTLVVEKANARVLLGGLDQIYSGAPEQVSATTVPSGLAVALTYDGTPNPPTEVGMYYATASVIDSNYTGSTAGVFAIHQAELTIQLGNLNQVYDSTPKTVSAITTPVSAPVLLTYDGMLDPPIAAGDYMISAWVVDANNYTGSATGTLSISKAKALIQLTNLTQVFDGTPKAVSAATIPPGLAVALTYDGQGQAPSAIGGYAVLASIVDLNYQGSATNWLNISDGTSITPPRSPELPYTPSLVTRTGLPPTPVKQPLLLSWLQTTNNVILWQSTDLATWSALTNIAAPSTSAVIIQTTAPYFFRATSVGPEGTNAMALSIRKP